MEVNIAGKFPELLAEELSALSPAELQVARALIDSNYLAGMENASRLAQIAGVSSPTVARFSERLGFENYNDMRQAIIRHYSDRLKGPNDLIDDRPEKDSSSDAVAESIHFQEIVADGLKPTNIRTMQEVGKKLSKVSVPVLSTGGTFSIVAARHLHMHLNALRKNCHFADARIGRQNELFDLKQGTIGIIFDFRRYQPDTFDFARELKLRGGRIVLITDPFLSPISELAEHIVTVRGDVTPPFDSAVGAIVVSEYLVQQVYCALGDSVRTRLKSMDALRSELR